MSFPAYQEAPQRKTLLTRVAEAEGAWIALERTLLHAPDPRYRHKAPCDRGHVLTEGHKLKIPRVAWRGARLLHEVTGPPPRVGADAHLHLDWPRRLETARAHTAMHVILLALAEGARAEVAEPAEVVGGARVRVRVRLRDASPRALAGVVARVNDVLSGQLPVAAAYATRESLAARAGAQGFPLEAVAPGEPTLRVVRIGDVSTLPCDAPLVGNTREVGRVALESALPRSDGSLRLLFRVLEK